MTLVETLESLVHNYLEDPTRPGSATNKVNAQDLVSHIAQHLAERGVDVGFQDGSRLTLPSSKSQTSEPAQHRLPLALQENDDRHVRIYCDGQDCCWSWPLCQYNESSDQRRHDHKRRQPRDPATPPHLITHPSSYTPHG